VERYIKDEVNKRTITWFLAALLALAANAAVPNPRVRPSGGDSAVVWIARNQAEQRILTRSHAAVALPSSPLTYQPPPRSRDFAPSLYQRPPPSLQ
jgi:hypothetical protein